MGGKRIGPGIETVVMHVRVPEGLRARISKVAHNLSKRRGSFTPGAELIREWIERGVTEAEDSAGEGLS